MWFKGFIVAALTASLAAGPFAGRVAKADPEGGGALPQLTKAVVEAAASELLNDLIIKEAAEGPICPDYALTEMLGAVDTVVASLFARPRAAHEVVLLGGQPVGNQFPVVIGEDEAILTVIQVTDTVDLGDKTKYAEIEDKGLAAFAGTYSSARRMTALMSSGGSSVLVHAVEITGSVPGLPSSLYFVLGASTDFEEPETTAAALPSFKCVLYSAGAAAAMTACFGCTGACATLIACLCAYGACCGSVDLVMNALHHCNGYIPAPNGAVDNFLAIVDVVCIL